ncbi:MAG: hypothetical protein L3J47_12070 [Sulfurovum sp.]|nr:hypothetical protein [Sulfurovum sp.]
MTSRETEEILQMYQDIHTQGRYDPREEAAMATVRPKNKYQRECKGITIDVYDVLVAFNVTNPATAHAIKKLLMPGVRGHKDKLTDLKEAKESIVRAIELEGVR